MSKERKQELIQRVIQLSNELVCMKKSQQDHVTICGFFTTEDQFAKHIGWLQKLAAA